MCRLKKVLSNPRNLKRRNPQSSKIPLTMFPAVRFDFCEFLRLQPLHEPCRKTNQQPDATPKSFRAPSDTSCPFLSAGPPRRFAAPPSEVAVRAPLEADFA